MDWPAPEELLNLATDCESKTEAANRLSVSRSTFNDHLKRTGIWDDFEAKLKRPEVVIQEKVEISGDEGVIYTKPQLGDMDTLLRDRGLDPDDWKVTSAVVNEWGPANAPMQQLKVHLQRVGLLEIVHPARTPVSKPKRKTKVAKGPEVIVVETDRHAPYHDPQLDTAVLKLIEDLQPVELVDLGDGVDFPTISRHNDHPAATASPQECVDAYYDLLASRADIVPNARHRIFRGNHSWRLESEILARAERLYGLAKPGDAAPLLSLQNLLRLDELGIELVHDERGWEHDQITLVEGRDGLVARHGFVTGNNTAGRTLNKLGVSALVGHDHTAAHHFSLDYPSKSLRQLVVVPAMCRNDSVFPHYVANPNWTHGCAVVHRWPDGHFHIEKAIWQSGELFYQDRRYAPDR